MGGTTVLIVDDNADNREVFRLLLEFSGYDTLMAEDGWSGVQQARALQPDLILMDVSMPVMDGFTATELLKSDPETRHIPIIALTAYETSEHRGRAFEIGMSGFLSKPATPGRVLDEIDRCLGTGRDTGAIGRPRHLAPGDRAHQSKPDPF
jgi:two-component system, cell cycle response regulator DivK